MTRWGSCMSAAAFRRDAIGGAVWSIGSLVRMRRSRVPWLFAVVVVVATSCSTDEPSDDGSSASVASTTSPDVVAEDETPSAAPTTEEMPGNQPDEAELEDVRIPAGPFYVPANLPDGWKVQALTLFPALDDGDLGGVGRSFVVHRSSDGFGVGAVTLELATFANEAEASEALTAALPEIGVGEPIGLDGMVEASIVRDLSGFLSVAGLLPGGQVMRISGLLPEADVTAVAEAIRVESGAMEPVLDPSLSDWVIEPLGPGGESYNLDFVGPGGSVTVQVLPGRTRASLFIGGHDLVDPLSGEAGEGYYAVQVEEEAGLEFPSVRWWVPDVDLWAWSSADIAVITDLLDRFVEVDESAFAEFVAEASISVIEFDDPAPAPEALDGVPVDPEVQARAVTFIEALLGRTFDEVPEIEIVDADALRANLPEGMFVPESLWDVLRTLELVSPDDDRLDADAARRERVRGVCCPVSIVDTGDPAFNEVVLVHELTHGLDHEIIGGGSSPEVVDPVLALVEGNAQRVALAYRDQLDAQGTEFLEQVGIFPADGDPRLPDAVQQILEFPYVVGSTFAADLASAGGEQAIVDAFSRPPSTSEQILNVEAYLADEQPANVPAPAVPPGADLRQQGSLGAFIVHLLLTPQLGPTTSTDVALTWDGDTYVLYDTTDQTCISATIEFDLDTSAQTLADTLELPGGTTAHDGAAASITNCVRSN